MTVRTSMAALISRVRLLINDTLPLGSGQIFSDQNVQDVMDETRLDVRNHALIAIPTYSGTTINYLDYFAQPGIGSWEDDVTLWQYRTVQVTPVLTENIVGHWSFTLTTLPPVYLNGKSYDCYRSAADLLERWSAQLVMSIDFTSDGQSFHASQASTALQKLACTYRTKQRAVNISFSRGDLVTASQAVSLMPTEIDYLGSG